MGFARLVGFAGMMADGTGQRCDGYAAWQERRRQRVQSLAGQLREQWPDPRGLVLELGCGHGHFLTAFAQAHPGQACLGVDVSSRRIRLAGQKAAKRHLDQLLFLKADATECLEALPPWLLLRQIFMLFPDPWPKKRHRKKRMLQAALLDLLAARAAPDATFHFRTDHEDNFAFALEQVASHRSWELADSLPWPFEAPSWFQDLLPDYSSFSARRLEPEEAGGGTSKDG